MSKGIALVTGAAQGIGRAIALRLASDGFDVALNDLVAKKDLVDAVAREVNATGRRAFSVCTDVSVEAEVKGMIDEVVKALGGLDVMVANAGISGKFRHVVDATVEGWDTAFAINTRGVFLCYKHAARQMIAQGRGGRIIGASSAAGKRGWPVNAEYCASKFAIRGLTQSAALELGQHKITVNSYAPGIIDTPMLDALLLKNGGDLSKQAISATAAGYIGQPEDIASIVSYLASGEAHFVTGQSISVDGGMVLS
ncbi:NAD(P)-binding protein [Leucogyrophana mollusca]|uniref:NAD(P)-binding protein n=1 Tax=Leucogyrophana mollusca TaxID=85980 RepID=A0ACB8BIA1_9AGAM|nr:NAD(P)-binding protein [Leucogyrophana mollusca]